MNPRLAELLNKCWQKDPAERPEFSEITIILQSILKEVFVYAFIFLAAMISNSTMGWFPNKLVICFYLQAIEEEKDKEKKKGGLFSVLKKNAPLKKDTP